MSFLRAIYQPLINIVFFVSHSKLKNKYTEGYGERCGAQSTEKLTKLGGRRPLWLHGVSVGEVQAAVPLIMAARADGYDGPVIISTTTETGKTMALRLGADIFDIHIYYPWDKRVFVSSALDVLKPWAFIATETELWPNMLWELEKRNIPAFLINGRISDRTWARLSSPLLRRIGKSLYDLFTEMFMRDARDVERLEAIGINAAKLFLYGDSKIDALLARKNPAAVDGWIKELGCAGYPVFVAGSTHPGEDEAVVSAFIALRASVPDAKLIIAPRHPERAKSVAEIVPVNFRTRILSDGSFGEWDVLVVDRIGVLFEIYGIASAAFVGGSFVDKGGQNILEPVLWGVPVQYGPHMEDFAEASGEFISLGIATRVNDSDELARAWAEIAVRDDRDAYLKISEKYFACRSGAACRTWDRIKNTL